MEAFRSSEPGPESLAALLAEDGFDLESVRVLGAWMRAEHGWVKPRKPCPDDGRPTARAYRWLCSGMVYDETLLAMAAGLSLGRTREKLAVLFGSQLLYPFGQITNSALLAIRGTIAERARKGKKREPEKTAKPAKDTN